MFFFITSVLYLTLPILLNFWIPFIGYLAYRSSKKKIIFSALAISFHLLVAKFTPILWEFGLKDYQKDRLILFLDPSRDPLGGGFHDWHYETMHVNSSKRSFVVQMYLNTIDEGGETEFLYINKRVKAKEGRVVIFPAAYTHTHRGNPAIGQDKYLITSWGLLQG